MRRAERAGAVVRTTKRYLQHHRFSLPALNRRQRRRPLFTPPELSGGTAYRFNVYL
jgi:hypothetical protein